MQLFPVICQKSLGDCFQGFALLHYSINVISVGLALAAFFRKCFSSLKNLIPSSFLLIQQSVTVKSRGQFALSLRNESPYIFCKFKPLNTDTSLLRTASLAPGKSEPSHFL